MLIVVMHQEACSWRSKLLTLGKVMRRGSWAVV